MLRWLEIISRIDFGNGDTQTVSLACSKPTCQLELQISLPVPLGAVRVTAFQSGNLREALCIGALPDCTAQCKSSAEAEPLFTHWGKTEFGCMYILHMYMHLWSTRSSCFAQNQSKNILNWSNKGNKFQQKMMARCNPDQNTSNMRTIANRSNSTTMLKHAVFSHIAS